MQLSDSLQIAAAGMQAQSTRLRVVAENLANVNTTPKAAGQLPYQRKLTIFENTMNKALGVSTIKTTLSKDPTEFNKKYAPYHPAADVDGYILTPNVDSVIEMTDLREARRGYEADLNVVQTTRGMLQQTIDLLRR